MINRDKKRQEAECTAVLAARCCRKVTVDEPLTPSDRLAPMDNSGTPRTGNASEVCIGDAALPRRLIAVPPCSSSPSLDKDFYRPLNHLPSVNSATRHRLRPSSFLRCLTITDYAGRVALYHFAINQWFNSLLCDCPFCCGCLLFE